MARSHNNSVMGLSVIKPALVLFHESELNQGRELRGTGLRGAEVFRGVHGDNGMTLR
jgi:hypothetical protein